jgi:hypothetical protein
MMAALLRVVSRWWCGDVRFRDVDRQRAVERLSALRFLAENGLSARTREPGALLERWRALVRSYERYYIRSGRRAYLGGAPRAGAWRILELSLS